MVKILLTETKQKSKFLSIPFSEQIKKGVLLDLESNMIDKDYYSNNIENYNDGEVFFTQSIKVNRKNLINHFNDHCKNDDFEQGLNKLSKNNEKSINEICRLSGNNNIYEEILDIENHPYFIHINSNYTKNELENIDKEDIEYEVNVNYPLLLSSNPKYNNPNDWLKVIEHIEVLNHSLKNINEKKGNPFDERNKSWYKQRKIYNNKKQKGLLVKEPKTPLIPKSILNTVIKTEFPNKNKDDVLFIGFLDEDKSQSYFVKQKIIS
ncbi:MAG: hypothetical protein WC934_06270 [Acidithiobacillus sp.]|jgi:hypothetical protein|uniref:hypothetical protein n=1 Tax=Acidithiobacillus sp. TaxID=1872118 RepID=UPI00355D5EDC